MEPCDPSQPPNAQELRGQDPNSLEDEEESPASDQIVYAMADLLRSQQLLDALKGWVTARTNELPAETAPKRQLLRL